jgi:hypothetical protein
VYGSPRSPRHGNWAFQYARTHDVWRGEVPHDVDILVTHAPPQAHLDLGRLGCRFLLDELWRCRPCLHVFGHVHGGQGTELVRFDALQRVYERTVREGGGLWNLMCAVASCIRAVVAPRSVSRSLLVNAAIVGGMRDEKTREPVVVRV